LMFTRSWWAPSSNGNARVTWDSDGVTISLAQRSPVRPDSTSASEIAAIIAAVGHGGQQCTRWLTESEC